MIRGTTPTITLTVDKDIDEWTKYVTFRSKCAEVTLEDDRLESSVEDDVTTILLTLTQAETLKLHGVADVQVRAIRNGTAVATDIQRINVGSILHDGEIS